MIPASMCDCKPKGEEEDEKERYDRAKKGARIIRFN